MTDSDSPGARSIELDAKRGEPDFVYRVLPKSMSEVWNDVWDRWNDNFQLIVFIKKNRKNWRATPDSDDHYVYAIAL